VSGLTVAGQQRLCNQTIADHQVVNGSASAAVILLDLLTHAAAAVAVASAVTGAVSAVSMAWTPNGPQKRPRAQARLIVIPVA